MSLRNVRPLAGLNVVDLVGGPLATIGRTLAELGADVVLIEPALGGSRPHNSDRRGKIRFAAANAGKKSVAVDLANETDLAKLDALIARADILIDDAAPKASIRLDVDEIHRTYPALTILSVSDFGTGNAFSDFQATDPVLHALSSELARSGIDGRAPLLPPGELAFGTASSQAVYVALVAYFNRLRSGSGDRIDFSALDGAAQALDPGYGIGGSAALGTRPSELPRGRPPKGFFYPIIDCADGRVRICVLAPRQWQSMFKWMGSPEEFADPKYNKTGERFKSPTLLPAIARFFGDKTRAVLEKEGEEHGVPIGAVLSLREAVRTDQIEARQAVTVIADGFGGSIQLPNGIMEINGQRMGPMSGAPAFGSNGANIGGQPLGATITGMPPAERPLAGLRVLDLGVIVVGADQGRLLADQGADVVKVEAKAFPDGSRGSLNGDPISAGAAAGHRNKRSLGLNLRDPGGKELFLKLAKKADVILSNFKPGTMESLGLGYEVISRANPGIIMADSSAFGPSGPWSRRMGYGPLVRANAGLTDRWRYPEDEESFSDSITIYPDHTAARYGVIGVLSLLIGRLRHGKGGTVSIAQAEIMLGHLAVEVAELAADLDSETPDAPWGVYPCKGDDEWCVVTVRNDRDWDALREATGFADAAMDTGLGTRDGRLAHRARIDEALRDWLSGRTPAEAMGILQSAGVPAAAMLRVTDLPEHHYFIQRNFYRTETHSLIADRFFVENRPVLSRDLKEPPSRQAPMMGEHTREVVADWLRLSATEIENLVDAGVLEPIEQAMAAE